MFGWLSRRVDPRRSAHERFLFHYWDGSADRRADPAAIDRELSRHLGRDWKERVAQLSDEPPFGVVGEELDAWYDKADKNRSAVLAGIDAAFGLRAVDQSGGLSESARLGVLAAYLLFCRQLVELARPFVKPQSRASPSPGPPPGPSGSECTSTASGSPASGPAN